MQQLNVFSIKEYLLYYDYDSHLGHHLVLLSLHMYYIDVKTYNNLYYDVYNIKGALKTKQRVYSTLGIYILAYGDHLERHHDFFQNIQGGTMQFLNKHDLVNWKPQKNSCGAVFQVMLMAIGLKALQMK